MKPGHAAALALVGWYLMVPPPVLHSSVPVDSDAPLSKWRIFSIHDSAAECEQGLVAFHKVARQNWPQTLLTNETGYNFTSLRTLSVSPPTIRALRKNSDERACGMWRFGPAATAPHARRRIVVAAPLARFELHRFLAV